MKNLHPSRPPVGSEVVGAILRRVLSHADRVRFAAVCRSWRAAWTRHPAEPLPWLALPTGTLFSFPSPVPFRFPAAARFHGSCDDWLVFNRDGDDDAGGGGYHLLNPFSGATMRLHAEPGPRPGRSDAPSSWPSSATGREGRSRRAAAGFWTVRAHEAWRRYRDIAFYDGELYVVRVDVDPRTGAPAVCLAKCVVRMPAAANRGVPVARHLVVSCGALLMVTRSGESAFAVFGIDRDSRWAEVRSVGDDAVIFVGRWSSVARRPVFKYKMPGNMIYFLDDDTVYDARFGAYDMRDGTTHDLLLSPSSSSPALHNDGDTPATWLFSREQASPAAAHLAHPNGAIFMYPSRTSLRFRFRDSVNYRGVAYPGLFFPEDEDGIGLLLQLRSPFTGRTRLLPSLLNVRVSHAPVDLDAELGEPAGQWRLGHMLVVQKLVALPDSGSGVIAALVCRDRFSKLALCSPVTTFSWAMSARDGWRKYEDMALFGGKLYAVTTAEDLIAFDVDVTDGGEPSVRRIDLAVKGGADVPVARYLVAEGETPRLAVFRADHSSRQWVEVSTLGDGTGGDYDGEVLFVGRQCSRGPGRDPVRRDQIFFFLPDYPSGYFNHTAVYDMRDGTVTQVQWLDQWRDAPAPPTWLFPVTEAEE
ncbi:hypothetical protein PR202_gb26574 [Eleusine coracana subsp. coracana]|uniref:KIB1-4 beta-propeller domain-containing protein n=1 Tax=Eleusine coracana subsp. coracana TaxID=191504 RepID=A0AAV5FSZ0_ELECO|nr:hypothetical protein PR202_gb26574 [Eleusine coracana subsp. coracana]